jgi:hypothetical protein
VQAKLDRDQPGDVFEQEADRVAAKVMNGAGDPGLQQRSDTVKLSHISPMIQRQAAEQATEPAAVEPGMVTPEAPAAVAAASEVASRGLIVEDDQEMVQSGQMKKSAFLSQVRAGICAAANAILAASGRTTNDCPYLNFWLNYYSSQSGQSIEQAIHRYAPETAGVNSARDYISLIVDRVSRAVTVWATTGEITGVPRGVSTAAPPAAEAGGAAAPAKTAGVQRKARDSGGDGTANVQAIQAQLASGKPLDSGVRSRMESAFGYDFSRVRIHTDSGAAHMAGSLNARAFTLGRDIAFGAGEYAPGSLMGEALIAHELAHVVQQGEAVSAAAPLSKNQAEGHDFEEDADIAAVGAVASLWSGAKEGLKNVARNALPRLRSGLRIQRCCDNRNVTVKYRLFAVSGFNVGSYCACKDTPGGQDKWTAPNPETPAPPGREVVWDGTGNCQRSERPLSTEPCTADEDRGCL